MKVVRVISNVLIGIILFCLIFALTFVRSTKKFLEKDVILGVVKETIRETIEEESGKLTDKSEELLNGMLINDDANDIIRMVIDNFDRYQENKTGYKVSDIDIEKIVSYANKYKSTIVEISGKKIKDLSDAEFKKIFSAENINSLANEVFESIDGDVGEGLDIAIKAYSKATSKTALIVLISSIVFFILLLLLINWSLYKWMLVTGIDLIVSGVLIGLVYVGGLIFNDIIMSTDIMKKAIGEIELTGYMICGIAELVGGIVLIVIYNVIKNKRDETFKQLDNL